jgi:predicted GH43/DUF377 family glycosyl hydrolase
MSTVFSNKLKSTLENLKEQKRKQDQEGIFELTSEKPPIFPNKLVQDANFPRSLCDYSTLEFIDTNALIDPDINLYYLNSCICKYKDIYRLFYRCSKNPKTVSDRIATCLLTTDLKVIEGTNKYIQAYSDWHESYTAGHTSKPREIVYAYRGDNQGEIVYKSYIYKNNEHVEDPRVIEYNNSWFLSYTDGLAVAIAKLDLDTCETIYSHFLKSPPKKFVPFFNDGREKNWILCQDNGRLFALYSEEPRTFIEYVDTGTSLECKRVFKDNYSVTWPYGGIRGGCPPIEYDDSSLIWFFHSVKKINTSIGNDKNVYMIGGYLTTKTYPFQVLKITPLPILVGVPSHFSENLYLQDNVVYPCGAISLDSQTFLISMGINDYRIAHLKVTKNMLRMINFNVVLESYSFIF